MRFPRDDERSSGVIPLPPACSTHRALAGAPPPIVTIALAAALSACATGAGPRPDAASDRADLPATGAPSERAADPAASPAGPVSERLERDRRSSEETFALVPHRINYFAPISYTSAIDDTPYREFDERFADGLRGAEVKFQLSVKARLNDDDLFLPDDNLSVAFTLESWWQLYADAISSPFRETNYRPEIFYLAPTRMSVLGGHILLGTGFEHQSNGQVQGLSRSWNRLFGLIGYERGRLALLLQPWYRLPEREKEDPLDPEGDDNPGVLDFYGNAEFRVLWRGGRHDVSLRVHGNPSTGKGGGTLAVTFPLRGPVRGYASIFDGYGQSLIDHDRYQHRISIGVALSPLP